MSCCFTSAFTSASVYHFTTFLKLIQHYLKKNFTNFHGFSWIHPKSLTPLLNDQNQLRVTRASYRKLGQRHILTKSRKFFSENKKDTNNSTVSYSMSIPFLSGLVKNKALYNFHKRRQHMTAGYIKGLD